MSKSLVKFLEINKILFKYQYGFRKLYSTTLALLEFTDKIIKYFDEGNYCISIFVDLTKAFDTVDHEILLQKLEHYGIRGHANDFFRTYLTNRQQYTVINDAKSSLGKIECGVPQGSVLGPLLSSVPDFFDRNKILSGYDLSHYQVPHCIRVFFYFVWFVFIHHNFQFYFKLCTYCNILDINLS